MNNINPITSKITTRTITGYVSAPLILLIIAASFSCCAATRRSASSSVPDASPAETSAINTLSKTSGCFANESDSCLPPSISAITSCTISCIFLFCVCSCTVRILCANGSPAPISVANCRVKTILSLAVTRPLNRAKNPLRSSSVSILSGINPCAVNSFAAAFSLSACTVDLTILLLALSLASYTYFFILLLDYPRINRSNSVKSTAYSRALS